MSSFHSPEDISASYDNCSSNANRLAYEREEIGRKKELLKLSRPQLIGQVRALGLASHFGPGDWRLSGLAFHFV